MFSKCLGHLISVLGHLSLSIYEVNIFENLAPPLIFRMIEDQMVHGSCKLFCSESQTLELPNIETLSLLVWQVPGSQHAAFSGLGDQEKDV